MTRLNSFYADWKQAPISNALTGVTAASISDVLTPASTPSYEVGYPYYPRAMRVAVELTGTITNTELAVSLGITDQNDVTFWAVAQTQEVRTLPDASKVVGIFVFDTLHATSLRVALETAITGGGTAKLFYCFQEGDVRA